MGKVRIMSRLARASDFDLSTWTRFSALGHQLVDMAGEVEPESEVEDSEPDLPQGGGSTQCFDPSSSKPPARRRVETYERDHWPVDDWITDSDDDVG